MSREFRGARRSLLWFVSFGQLFCAAYIFVLYTLVEDICRSRAWLVVDVALEWATLQATITTASLKALSP